MWQGYIRKLQSIHECWSTNRQTVIPVNEMTSKIGQDVSICLPASHAISGCDTTSSLFKTGKRTAYNTLVVNIAYMLSLAELGHSSYARTMRARVTKLHLSSQQHTMPLNSTSHASITKWLIWIHSHAAKPDLWNADDNGWQLRNNRLEPVMFERDGAPKEVRDLTHLYCIDEYRSQARTCQ